MNYLLKSLALIYLSSMLGGCATRPLVVPYQVPSSGGVNVSFVTDVASVSDHAGLRVYAVPNPGCKGATGLQEIVHLKSDTLFEGLRRPDIKERRANSKLRANVELPLLFSYSYSNGREVESCNVPIAFKLSDKHQYEMRFTTDRKNGVCAVSLKSIDSIGNLSRELPPIPYPYDCN